MSYVRTRRGFRGLGAAPSVQQGVLGTTFDCSDAFTYYTSPSCWNYALAAWRQMNVLAEAVGPLPSPPVPTAPTGADLAAVTSGAYSPSTFDQITTNTLTGPWQQWQQALTDYFGQAGQSLQNAPDVQGGTGGTNWGMVAIIAAVGLVGAVVLANLTDPRRG